jgi:hypothetical protein
VVDCRICGDPHSVLRFAFIEFADDGSLFKTFPPSVVLCMDKQQSWSCPLYAAGARAALTLGGTMLGYYPVRVLPSKTAILPVNPKFLPQVSIWLDCILPSTLSLHCQFIFFMSKFQPILFVLLFSVQTEDEKEMVSRTVYCTNIDKKVCESLWFLTMHNVIVFEIYKYYIISWFLCLNLLCYLII